jgi:hypothetical protein
MFKEICLRACAYRFQTTMSTRIIRRLSSPVFPHSKPDDVDAAQGIYMRRSSLSAGSEADVEIEQVGCEHMQHRRITDTLFADSFLSAN